MPHPTAGVDELLEQINDAVEDWEVSRDAMRCHAPADIPRPGQQAPAVHAPRAALLGTWDQALTPRWPTRIAAAAAHQLVSLAFRRLRIRG